MAFLEQINDTEFNLKGDLIFSTTATIYKQSLSLFNKNTDKISINLSAVEHSDSSGLALIVEWYRLAKKNNQSIRIMNMPEQMCDLAKLSSVDELLAE